MASQISVQYFADFGLEIIRAANVTHHLSRHAHNTLCVGIIETGVRESTVRGVKSLACAGKIVLHNPGEIHACSAAGGMPYSYQMLCLDRGCIKKLFGQYAGGECIPDFKGTVIDDMECFKEIKKLGSAFDGASQLERETALVEMFASLMRHAEANFGFAAAGREDAMVRKVREYVAAHCTEEISLDTLSDLVNFSPYYLHRVFTARVGIPLHAYQLLLRIDKAKVLLLQDKPYAIAAAETGFADQSHFSRRFKEVIGLTPGQWLRARLVR